MRWTAIRSGCTPETAGASLTLPVCLYPVGYLLGGLLVGPLSDRLGRRATITGSLAVGNTCTGEIAPAAARARYTATTFVLCTLGAMSA